MNRSVRLAVFCSSRTIVLSIVLLLVATTAIAIEFSLESETLVRSFERDTNAGTDQQVLPAYEYLTLDIERLKDKRLSFHAYGWGRHDFADNNYFEDQTDGELIYAYLQYANSHRNRSIRLGRQQVYAGVANDALDGLSAASDLGDQFSVSIYGGLPVGLNDSSGSSGDSIWGGRLAHRYGIFSNIGLSYQKVENDNEKVSEKFGIDSAFLLPMNIGLYGNSVRNLETDGWSEHNYWLHILYGNLSVRPFYEFFQYDDYFDTGSLNDGPFNFLSQSGEELATLGVDFSWQQSPSWTFAAQAKNYNYELSDTSNYLSISAVWSGNFSTQAGVELGKMEGDAADNDYLLLRLFCYLDHLSQRAWVDFISGDLIYTSYDQDIYGEDYAYFASFGGGKTWLNGDLKIKLSADYSQDPYYDDDLRGMLTAIYRFDTGRSN